MIENYSNMAVYLKCPLQYHGRVNNHFGPLTPEEQQRALKNQFIGHVFAKLTERFYTEKWWQPKVPSASDTMKVRVLEIMVKQREKQNILFTNAEWKDWIIVANDTIPKILAIIREHKLLTDSVRTEYTTSVTFGEDTLKGRWDLSIHRPDGSIDMIDGKGGKTYGKYVDPEQLLFYGLGSKEDKEINKWPVRFGFWWFRHQKIQWRKFKTIDIEGFKKKVIDSFAAIKKNEYPANPGGYCRLCDYRAKCPVGMTYINSHATKVPEIQFDETNIGEFTL